jgi:hypothetical protein
MQSYITEFWGGLSSVVCHIAETEWLAYGSQALKCKGLTGD